MATKTAKVNARIEPKLKKETEQVLGAIGLSTTDAIRVYFKQIVYRRGLPFDVRMPNRATRNAMKQARNNYRLKTHKQPEDHFKHLGI